MDYYGSSKGIIITRHRAFAELKAHGVVDFKEFITKWETKNSIQHKAF